MIHNSQSGTDSKEDASSSHARIAKHAGHWGRDFPYQKYHAVHQEEDDPTARAGQKKEWPEKNRLVKIRAHDR
jgi:hypothetical protein